MRELVGSHMPHFLKFFAKAISSFCLLKVSFLSERRLLKNFSLKLLVFEHKKEQLFAVALVVVLSGQ